MGCGQSATSSRSKFTRHVTAAIAAAAEHARKYEIGPEHNDGFSSKYQKDFLRIWTKPAGENNLTIQPNAALELCKEFARAGYYWECDADDSWTLELTQFFSKFNDTAGIPLLAFSVWREDEGFEDDEWYCLIWGGAAEDFSSASEGYWASKKDNLRHLIKSLLVAAAHYTGKQQVPEQYVEAFRDTWEKHGQGFYINVASVEGFAEDMIRVGWDDWQLQPDDKETLADARRRGGHFPLVGFVLWSEDDDFCIDHWMPKPVQPTIAFAVEDNVNLEYGNNLPQGNQVSPPGQRDLF